MSDEPTSDPSVDSKEGVREGDAARGLSGVDRGLDESNQVAHLSDGVSSEADSYGSGESGVGFQSVQIAAHHSGPLPSPEVLGAYPDEFQQAILNRFQVDTRNAELSSEAMLELSRSEARGLNIGSIVAAVAGVGAVGGAVFSLYLGEIAAVAFFLSTPLVGQLAKLVKASRSRD